jgi:hypothetical protein
MLFKSYNLGLLADIPPPNGGLTFHDLMFIVCEADPFPTDIVQILHDGIGSSKKIFLGKCKQDNGLYYYEKVYLPDYTPFHLHVL